MKRILAIMLLTALFLPPGAGFSSDSGIFRGKWWNYYERGLESAERGDLPAALKDLRQAASMRDRDQRNARTYGMHFVDYFPHREIGVVLCDQGDLAGAAKELEESIRSEETAKAAFYLNKVKQLTLERQQVKAAAPEITVISPAPGTVVKTATVAIKGKAAGAGSVAKIAVNGEPYRFERARESVEFTQEVPVEDGRNELVVTAEDLLGAKSEKTVTVIVDRDGPSVQVFDVKAEVEGGKKYVRLTGEVSDATWISRLTVNGKAVDVSGEKSMPLDLRWEQGTHPKLTVQAVDPFENETNAVLDVEKELTAQNRPPRPFLIALNADKLFGFDKDPPGVSLRSAGEVPPVLSERYYVEGEASDNRNVGRIVINGKDVYAKGGRKIFFSKVVTLAEGKNDIVIDVYDTSDNRTSRKISVTRKVPEVMQNNARMSITVLPFDGGRAAERVQLAYEQLIGAFVDQKRFSVIERSKLEQILLEQKLTKEKLTDPENSIRVGRLMSADAILATTVREDARSFEIVARIISTETSEVLGVKDVFAGDKDRRTVKESMANLAAKVAVEFPVVEGMVVKASGRNIVMDVGETSNLKSNMSVIFFRKGQEIRHPVTGRSLGWETVKLAVGRIEDVQANFSKVRLLDRPSPKEVRVKDLAITK